MSVLAQVTVSFWKYVPDNFAGIPGGEAPDHTLPSGGAPDQSLPEPSPGKPGHLPAPPSGEVKPPIIWPGDPSQGLPPMIGWPLPDPDRPGHLPAEPPGGIWPRPPAPGQPLPPSGSARPPKPGHPIARPPIHFPGKPDQGLPPMVGYPLPPDICNPPPGSPEWPDQGLPPQAQPK